VRHSGADVFPLVAVESQVLYRRVNERILALLSNGNLGRDVFVCECGHAECSQPLELTAAKYEEVRGDGARFVVVPGHEVAGADAVVAATDRCVVVEKVGPGRALALRTDPRRTADG
jgi:hypothetical protein